MDVMDLNQALFPRAESAATSDTPRPPLALVDAPNLDTPNSEVPDVNAQVVADMPSVLARVAAYRDVVDAMTEAVVPQRKAA